MSFTEKLKLIIDVDTKGATTGLSGLKTKMSEAEGFFGKLKAGASGLKDSFTALGPAGQAGVLAGGITAVGTAAYKVADQVADLGIAVGDVRDKTGLGAEAASRYKEVFNDLGISTETLEGVLGKMNKNLDPAKFQEYGIAIAHAKDGTVDVSETFLNAIDRLNGMRDATDRAKAEADIFGKNWASVSELVGRGADDMRARLADVEKQKIFNDSDIADARAFRDTMDGLRDAAQDVALELGKALLPLVKDIAEQATGAAKDLEPIIEGLTKVIDLAGKIPEPIKIAVEVSLNPLAGFNKAMDAASEAIDTNSMSLEALNKMLDDNGISAGDSAAIIKSWHDANDAAGDGLAHLTTTLAALNASLANGGQSTGEFAARQEDAAAAAEAQAKRMDEEAAAVERVKNAEQAYTDVLQGEVDALHAAADALNEKIDGALNAADSQLALNKAEEDFAAAAENTLAVQKEKGKSSDEYKKAVEDERDAVIDAAKAQVKLSSDQADALGVTQSATTKIDSLNQSLEDQAAFATPAARKAVYDYLIQLNQIPPDKATEIQAAVAAGDLVTAKRLLDEASATRQAAIIADAKTDQANKDLDALAHDRHANIYARTIAVGASLGLASGGPAKAGSTHLVGERGPELVTFGSNATVTNASDTRQMLNGDGGGDTFNIAIQVRQEPSERWLAAMAAKARRRGYAA